MNVHSSWTASSSPKDLSTSEISSMKSSKDFLFGGPATDDTHWMKRRQMSHQPCPVRENILMEPLEP
jgi:hypothetical protein